MRGNRNRSSAGCRGRGRDRGCDPGRGPGRGGQGVADSCCDAGVGIHSV